MSDGFFPLPITHYPLPITHFLFPIANSLQSGDHFGGLRRSTDSPKISAPCAAVEAGCRRIGRAVNADRGNAKRRSEVGEPRVYADHGLRARKQPPCFLPPPRGRGDD